MKFKRRFKSLRTESIFLGRETPGLRPIHRLFERESKQTRREVKRIEERGMGEANALVEEAARLAEQARELQDAAAALLSKTSNEEQALRQRALALESDLKRLRSSLDSAAKKNPAALDPKIAGKIDEELYRARCLVNDGDVASLLPSKAHGRFLRMFLGPVNVRATRKEVQLKVKEEYNSYRV